MPALTQAKCCSYDPYAAIALLLCAFLSAGTSWETDSPWRVKAKSKHAEKSQKFRCFCDWFQLSVSCIEASGCYLQGSCVFLRLRGVDRDSIA